MHKDQNKRLERTKKRLQRILMAVDYRRKQRLKYPLADFVCLMPYMAKESVAQLAKIEPPAKFCKRDVPKDLQGVSFGVLTRLQQAPDQKDIVKTWCNLVSVLTDVPAEKVRWCKAVEVLGIVNMIQKEMERIGKLFQSLQTEHSSDELQAGIDKLNFGAFGLVDWYAKRMGIVDHEEVFATPWARIWQCMRIDHENNEFEKRYRNIIQRGIKKK